jgi:hypothetical protein
MATKKITDLVELISAASGDVLPIVDISDDITKKIQVSNFPISTAAQTAIDAKQDTLVSGTNIKTINSNSLLGSGDIAISASPSGVAGAIQFSDGSAFASDAANLFWDDTNNRLGIGTNAPASQQEIKGNGDQLWITNSGDIYTYLKFSANGGFLSMTFGDGNGTVNYLNNYSTGMWASNKFAFGPSLFAPSGQVHIKGSGSTSATTSLLVQNSAGAETFKVQDNGVVVIENFTFVSGSVIENTTTRLVATTGGVAVNSNYAFANSSSILDVASTTKGFLPPRMTTTQKNAISTPASGLMVYDTDLNQMSYYNGTSWVNI